MTATKILKPNPRENKTTIQITKEIKEKLTQLGNKGESYNFVIKKLIDIYENRIGKEDNKNVILNKSRINHIQVSKNITITQFERITISIKDYIAVKDDTLAILSPVIRLEVSYNKPVNKEDSLYQIDLKIDKVIFDNEIYSPKEFFGVLQKDMVYCEEFVYYYLKSILEVIKIEFKKSNYFFKNYHDYLDLARWRMFLLNSKLSPELLASDVESIFGDLKNKKTNQKLISDVQNSYYNKIIKYSKRY